MDWRLLVAVVGQLVGLGCFLFGFFPVQPPTRSTNSWERTYESLDLDKDLCSPSKLNRILRSRWNGKKLVWIVIDALRDEFMLRNERESSNNMPFVHEAIQNGTGIGFTAKTQAPTVTMPRIKAMTVGNVPAFIDVILNIASSELTQDNIIDQLKNDGHHSRLHFFGDDTWIRLFPGRFAESDGTTSFFVSDYTEVDDNVTRRLDSQLNGAAKLKRWDVMILHYLGLDHIGHSLGRQSRQLPIKLEEMDRVIKRIYTELQQEIGEEFLIVALGDHGMSDIGSHGGATPAETNVPLLFMSPAFGERVKGDPIQSPQPKIVIQQIDLVTTLATLFNLPIPSSSLGLPIQAVMKAAFGTGENLQRKLLFVNYLALKHLERLKGMDQTSIPDVDSREISKILCMDGWKNGSHQKLQDSMDSLISKIVRESQKLQNSLMESMSDYNTTYMWIGIFVSTATSVYLLQIVLNHPYRSKSSCFENVQFFSFIFILTGSYASSSFVEEEHQTHYWLWPTLLILLIFDLLRRRRQLAIIAIKTNRQKLSSKPKQNPSAGTGACFKRLTSSVATNMKVFGFLLVMLCAHRLMRSWNSTGDKWSHLPDIGDFINLDGNEAFKFWVVSAVFALSIFYALTRIALGSKRSSIAHHSLHFTLVTCALFFAYLHHLSSGALQCPVWLKHWISYWSVLCDSSAILCYASSSVLIIFIPMVTAVRRSWFLTYPASSSQRNSVKAATESFNHGLFCLLMLLMRPHNSPLLAMIVVSLKSLVVIFNQNIQTDSDENSGMQNSLEETLSAPTFIYAFALTCHFYLGNSNSLGSVDLSSGYKGLHSYRPEIIGILVYLHTYAGPLLILTSSWVNKCLTSSKKNKSAPFYYSSLPLYQLFLLNSIPVSVYLCVVMVGRHHLFIWSVFAPKLLYQTIWTATFTGWILFQSLWTIM